jgi:hypothetical protein
VRDQVSHPHKQTEKENFSSVCFSLLFIGKVTWMDAHSSELCILTFILHKTSVSCSFFLNRPLLPCGVEGFLPVNLLDIW